MINKNKTKMSKSKGNVVYPELLIDYINKCKNKEVKIGKMYYFKTNDKLIVNFPTKDDYKFPSKIEWIEEGLKDFVKTYKTYKINQDIYDKVWYRYDYVTGFYEKIVFTKNNEAERSILFIVRLPSPTTFGIEAKLESSKINWETFLVASLPFA